MIDQTDRLDRSMATTRRRLAVALSGRSTRRHTLAVGGWVLGTMVSGCLAIWLMVMLSRYAGLARWLDRLSIDGGLIVLFIWSSLTFVGSIALTQTALLGTLFGYAWPRAAAYGVVTLLGAPLALVAVFLLVVVARPPFLSAVWDNGPLGLMLILVLTAVAVAAPQAVALWGLSGQTSLGLWLLINLLAAAAAGWLVPWLINGLDHRPPLLLVALLLGTYALPTGAALAWQTARHGAAPS